MSAKSPNAVKAERMLAAFVQLRREYEAEGRAAAAADVQAAGSSLSEGALARLFELIMSEVSL